MTSTKNLTSFPHPSTILENCWICSEQKLKLFGSWTSLGSEVFLMAADAELLTFLGWLVKNRTRRPLNSDAKQKFTKRSVRRVDSVDSQIVASLGRIHCTPHCIRALRTRERQERKNFISQSKRIRKVGLLFTEKLSAGRWMKCFKFWCPDFYSNCLQTRLTIIQQQHAM